MTNLSAPAHCLDGDFEALILEKYQVKVIDRTGVPWNVVFEGSRDNLIAMYNGHWGDSPIDADSDLLSEPTIPRAVVAIKLGNRVPKIPFILQTTLTILDLDTSIETAIALKNQIESLYGEYYALSHPDWTWNDTHDHDRDALIELEEIIRASKNPPLDEDLVSSFRNVKWKNIYQK